MTNVHAQAHIGSGALEEVLADGSDSSLVIIVTTPSADSKPLLSRLLLKHSEASRRLRDVRGLAGFQCWENSTRITSPPSICIRASGVSMFPIRV